MTSAPITTVIARAEAVTKTYGTGDAAVHALAGVDLDLDAGSFTAIMGPSGSGKSTLMHCLAGLDSPTSGRIWLGGTEITGLDDRRLTALRRDSVGFVFQAFNLLPTLTAKENILLPLDLAGKKPDTAALDAVVGSLRLGDRLGHLPSSSRAVNSNGSRSPARSSPVRRCCSPTSRPEHWTPAPGPNCSPTCARRATSWDKRS